MPEGSQAGPCGTSAGCGINHFLFQETDDEVLSSDAFFLLWRRKERTKISRIVMESGREFAAKIFIDASYEGDMMARAGVKYIVGREPNSLSDETLNGAFPFPPAPFPKISPYVIADDPQSGLLPRVERGIMADFSEPLAALESRDGSRREQTDGRSPPAGVVR